MNSAETLAENYQRAAQAIRDADGLLIAAGAGMGVDSGLPDFRGKNGFWKAYPVLGHDKIDFHSIASPEAFMQMPGRAWGFYGHRLKLYRDTVPHDGFRLLREMGATLPLGAFVYTSNVDGQFQKAGFPQNNVCEIHGSIHHLQCMNNCHQTWSADEFQPEVDAEQCRLVSPLPRCPRCHELARPHILMFNDWRFIMDRVEMQQIQFDTWVSRAKNLVTIEIGAGTNLPSIRSRSQRLIDEMPNLGMIIIDYLQLMGGRKKLLEIVQELKQLAKDLNVPIIVLYQLDMCRERTKGYFCPIYRVITNFDAMIRRF